MYQVITKLYDLTNSKFLSSDTNLGNISSELKTNHMITTSVNNDKDLVSFDYEIPVREILLCPYLNECRGITFDKSTLEIVSGPFNKFFNVGENDRWTEDNVELMMDNHFYTVMNKIDGSMIHSFKHKNVVHYHTRKGQTDTANYVANFLDDSGLRDVYDNFITLLEETYNQKVTVLYEYTSPENQIVIDYGNDRKLTLLGARLNRTGRYLLLPEIHHLAVKANIPTVSFSVSRNDFKTMRLDDIKKQEGIEGVVIALNMGMGGLVKVKTDWYFSRHKVSTCLDTGDIIYHTLMGSLDDMIPYIPDNKKDDVLNISNSFNDQLKAFLNKAEDIYSSIEHIENQKEFAAAVKDYEFNSFLFKRRKYGDFSATLKDFLGDDNGGFIHRVKTASNNKLKETLATFEIKVADYKGFGFNVGNTETEDS